MRETKELGRAVGDFLKQQKEKYDAGEFDKLIDQVSQSLKNLKSDSASESTEVKDELRNLQKELRQIDPDKITPEQRKELEELIRQIESQTGDQSHRLKRKGKATSSPLTTTDRSHMIHQDIALVGKRQFTVKSFQENIASLFFWTEFKMIGLPVEMIDQRTFIDELILRAFLLADIDPQPDRSVISGVGIRMRQVYVHFITAAFFQVFSQSLADAFPGIILPRDQPDIRFAVRG